MDSSVYRLMAQTQEAHWWFAGRRKILRAIIAQLRLPACARILEIGCGTGGNLPMLTQFGTVCGVEIDDFALARAREVSNCEIQKGWLPDRIPFHGELFDLVCLLDVLEHVDDDEAALSAVAKRIKPGGLAVVTVPAYQWLYGSHDRLHHHYRRYSAGHLRRKATVAGLRVLRLGYFNALLFPLIAAVRLCKRVLPSGGRDEAALPGHKLNRWLYGVLSFEAAFAPRAFFPFGATCIAVLERR
ncbi:MAG: class I SAM-dependent methyltransferase [Betaproteobacteria bacterium]|nr:MAG: class I SAM-dependent methyltransferase [Betaproteobacteria bacterium]